MMNTGNFGMLRGRLTRDLVTFNNTDGSRKMKGTIAVQQNYVSGTDKTKKSDFVPFEAFINKDVKKKTVYEMVGEGDLVNIQFTIRTQPYQDEEGKTVYPVTIVAEQLDILESKAVTEARRQQKAANAGAEAGAEGAADAAAEAQADEQLPFN